MLVTGIASFYASIKGEVKVQACRQSVLKMAIDEFAGLLRHRLC